MPLVTKVDFGPGHNVLDGVLAVHERGTAAPPPLFGPCLFWPRLLISATAELLLSPPRVADADIKFLPCGFLFYYLFFPRLISAVADWMSTILLHYTSVALVRI